MRKMPCFELPKRQEIAHGTLFSIMKIMISKQPGKFEGQEKGREPEIENVTDAGDAVCVKYFEVG